MKLSLFLYFLLISVALFGQTDSAALERDYHKALDFSEAEVDSIGYYANFIGHAWFTAGFPRGKVLSLRLYGFYYENKADYKQAVDYYIQTLDQARKLGYTELQINSLTDLAVVYAQDIQQPRKAEAFFLECIPLSRQLGDLHSLLSIYVNLGAIYNHLQLYDSALTILQEGLKVGQPMEENGLVELTNLYNNLGNTYYFLKRYDQALVYFRHNYDHDLAGDSPTREADLWFDVLNMADCYSEQGKFDSAAKYAGLAIDRALHLASKSKQSDSYKVLSRLALHQRDYKKAYEYQGKWYAIDTALVNSETFKDIAELEEKYEARQRENEKLLLQEEVQQQKFHSRIMMVMAISLLLIAIVAAAGFIVKRKVNRQLQATNDLVVRQNERLSELNYEKNSLISIVSHDLSTPFASIGMWTQLLRSDPDKLTTDQQKAVSRIEQATGYGEKLIRQILDVEKAQTNQHKVQLENLDLRIFSENIIGNFQPAAEKKNIQLHLDCPQKTLYFLSDRQLLTRMLENLLSNAIKYTSRGKNVWMSVSEEKDAISIKVRDEGVGIEKDELPHLFSKYSKISSQPTNGEPSTGLGLAIVKRICEELNGQVSCESSPGEGSIFTLVLKK